MKINTYQSEEFCLDDIRGRDELRSVFDNSSKLIEKMLKEALQDVPSPSSIEVGFYSIPTKDHNLRAMFGFWDVQVKPSNPNKEEWELNTPKIVKMNKRIENRQVVVWE